MDDSSIIAILTDFNDILTKSNPLSAMIRWIGFATLRGLSFVVDGFQNILIETYDFIDFSNSAAVRNIVKDFAPIIIAIGLCALVYLGMQVTISAKKEYISIFRTVVIMFFVVLAIPTVMSQMSNMVVSAVGSTLNTNDGWLDIGSGETMTHLSDMIILENVVDVLQYDKNGFTSSPTHKTMFNSVSDALDRIDPIEEIDPDASFIQTKDVFRKEIRYDADGNPTLKDMQGWFKFDTFYYRYDIHFFTVIGTLLSITIGLVFTSIKVVRLCFDLAFSQLFAVLTAVSSFSSSRRTAEVIKVIVSSYIVLFFMSLLMLFYIHFAAYVSSSDIFFLTKIIALIAATFALIDGPNIIERVIGMDAGISSATKTLASMYTGGKMAIGGMKLFPKSVHTVNTAARNIGTKLGEMDGIDAGMKMAVNDNKTTNVQPNDTNQMRNEQAFKTNTNEREESQQRNTIQTDEATRKEKVDGKNDTHIIPNIDTRAEKKKKDDQLTNQTIITPLSSLTNDDRKHIKRDSRLSEKRPITPIGQAAKSYVQAKEATKRNAYDHTIKKLNEKSDPK